MIEVRHGSGAYVSPDGESLVAMSLGTVIQLDGVGASDALGLLSVLNEYAAARAVEQATPADMRRLRDATQALENVQSERQAIAGVRAFHRALVQAAHHRLLEVICSFLTDVQIEVAREAAEGELENWHRILASLSDVRSRFVTAIERRDVKAARKLAQEFHACAIASITTLPKAEQVQLADPQLGSLLSSIVSEMTRRP
jgi:GntR family transcriptional repressor for pyruvate dehydrogenase complex